MTVFAILTPPHDAPATQDAFAQSMARVFGHGNFRLIDAGQYVAVKANATSQQITGELGGSGQVGKFVVVSSAGYWGYHDKALWEWISAAGGA